LKVKDVYENGKVKDTLRLLAGYTKGEKHRDLALSNSEVIKAIRAAVVAQEEQYHRINTESPLFRSNRGSSFSANSMRRVLKTIYINAGYPDASSHSGRRSMITRLAEKGIDVNSIRIIAGHSSLQTTQRYIEENPARLANILKGLWVQRRRNKFLFLKTPPGVFEPYTPPVVIWEGGLYIEIQKG